MTGTPAPQAELQRRCGRASTRWSTPPPTAPPSARRRLARPAGRRALLAGGAGWTPPRPSCCRARATRSAPGRAMSSTWSAGRRRPPGDRAPGLVRRRRRRPRRHARRLRQTSGMTGAEVIIAGAPRWRGSGCSRRCWATGGGPRRPLARPADPARPRPARRSRRASPALLDAVAPAATPRATARTSRRSGPPGERPARAAPGGPRGGRRARRGPAGSGGRRRRRRVVRRAGERLGHGLDATVVALAGPTGAGKSTSSTCSRDASCRAPASGDRPAATTAPSARGGTACSTGSTCAHATRSTPARPTGRPARPPDFDSVEAVSARRTIGSSSWSTCSSGSWTRRSTPTPPCTSATCARSRTRRGDARRVDQVDLLAAAWPPPATTCAGCSAVRSWATSRSSPSPRAPAKGRTPCAG